MARYTGPKVRLSRRLSTNIFENEKGRKALDRRPFPPGAHGRDGGALERPVTRQALVRHHAERPDVCRRAHVR